jgi:hypothetical protein
MPDTRVWKWLVDWVKALDLLPAYFRAASENFLNVIFGPGVLAILYCVWALIAMPPLAVTLMFLVGAILVASYYLWRADHLQLVPKVTLRFENRVPFKQPAPMEDAIGVKMYFRVFPDSLIPVPGCAGYLLAVYREIDGNWRPTLFDEPVALIWADGRSGPITVEPEIGPYLNIFYVDSTKKESVPCLTSPTLRTSAVFREQGERGTFRFDIKITNGERITLKVKMDERTSYWDRPLVELLPNGNNPN